MFYDTFDDLCRSCKIAPSALARRLGMSSSAPGRWKNGSTPDLDTAAKIADFFGVTVDYLLGRESTNHTANTFHDANSSVVVLGSEGAKVSSGDMNAAPEELTDQEQEVLRIFRGLDMRTKNKALTLLYELEDSKGQ